MCDYDVRVDRIPQNEQLQATIQVHGCIICLELMVPLFQLCQ